MGAVRGREETRDQRLEDALERERGKETRLDDLFEQAKKRLEEEPED